MAWTLSGMGHSEGRQAGGCGNSAKSALTAVAMQGPAYAVTELFNPVHIIFQHISDHIVTSDIFRDHEECISHRVGYTILMVPRVSIPQVGFIPCSGAGHLCWLNDEALLIGWDQELGTDKTSDNIRLFIYGAQKIFMFVH